MRYHLEPMQTPAYHKWLLGNEALVKDNTPEGWTYLGTWFTVRGFGSYECERSKRS